MRALYARDARSAWIVRSWNRPGQDCDQHLDTTEEAQARQRRVQPSGGDAVLLGERLPLMHAVMCR
jgi:hypothetical protein